MKPVGRFPVDYEMDHTNTEKAQVELKLLAALWLLKDITRLLKDITSERG